MPARQKSVDAYHEKLRRAEERERRHQIRVGTAHRNQRLALLGYKSASCSVVAGMEFHLGEKRLRAGRQDNSVHHYLSMRAFAADRLGGGGMGWHVFEFYCTCIALVMRLDKFNTGWDFDDDYVVEMRNEAFRLALEHGYLPYLGYEFKLKAVREYLVAGEARRQGIQS